MVQLIIAVLGSSAFTAAITWLIGRSKARAEVLKIKAETEQIKLDNIENLIAIYKETSEDLRKEVHTLRLEVSELRKENFNLKSEIKKLEKTLADFQHTT